MCPVLYWCCGHHPGSLVFGSQEIRFMSTAWVRAGVKSCSKGRGSFLMWVGESGKAARRTKASAPPSKTSKKCRVSAQVRATIPAQAWRERGRSSELAAEMGAQGLTPCWERPEDASAEGWGGNLGCAWQHQGLMEGPGVLGRSAWQS